MVTGDGEVDTLLQATLCVCVWEKLQIIKRQRDRPAAERFGRRRRRGTRTSRAVMPKRRRDDAPAAAAPAGSASQLVSGALEAKIRELVLARGANKTC